MVAENPSNDSYELDLTRVLGLIKKQWVFILLVTVVVFFLFGLVLILFGSEREAHSETIQYFSESLLTSVNIDLLPVLVTEERVLYQLYESDQNPDKSSFDDYASQFSAEVVHSDAISLEVTGKELKDTSRLVRSWQEIIDQDVLNDLRSFRKDFLDTKIQDKFLEYQTAYLAYQSYYQEAEIEGKSQQLNQYKMLINQYTQDQNKQRLLQESIQNMQNKLAAVDGQYQLSSVDLLLLEKILTRYASTDLVVDPGGFLYAELLLPSPPIKSDVLPLLEGIEDDIALSLAFQEAEIGNASAQITLLQQEVEQDPRLIELEELANYQKRQYLNAVDELEKLSEEGYSISYSWMEPSFSIWEQIEIIQLAVIFVAAICAAVFLLIIQDWWKSTL